MKRTSNIIKTPQGAKTDGVKRDPFGFVPMNVCGFPARAGTVPVYLEKLEQGECSVKVSKRFGMTYKEEIAAAVENIRPLIQSGIDAFHLYDDLAAMDSEKLR